MNKQSLKTRRLTFLAVMVALDVVLNFLRIEGMAPFSSVINIVLATMMAPEYVFLVALMTSFIRVFVFSIPILAIPGAIFGAGLAGYFYHLKPHILSAIVGELIGTGLIGALVSYPLMMWIGGSAYDLVWFTYVPLFTAAALLGSLIAFFVYQALKRLRFFKEIKDLFSWHL